MLISLTSYMVSSVMLNPIFPFSPVISGRVGWEMDDEDAWLIRWSAHIHLFLLLLVPLNITKGYLSFQWLPRARDWLSCIYITLLFSRAFWRSLLLKKRTRVAAVVLFFFLQHFKFPPFFFPPDLSRRALNPCVLISSSVATTGRTSCILLFVQ